MKTDYCAYPPQLAADVEVTEQRDGARLSYIAGSASVGRYLLLRETEYKVFSLLDGSRAASGVREEFKQRYGGSLPLATLVKFLSKLEEYGILAGERAAGYAPAAPQSQQAYIRFKLFDPDPLFARLTARLRWIWTTGFFAGSLAVMLATLLLALMNWAEVASYGARILRDHFVAVIAASLLVVITHEFAHGLTCKVFGGRATEVGVLLVYYFLPAFYCNVSGIHFIPQRGRRLWVIAAGVYWQLMAGAASLLCWFLLAPHTLLADLAFIFFCGSVLDVFFNGNPLIKLDGYYFLSQWLRLPNLMDRSRAYWRGQMRFLLFGERSPEATKWSRRERAIHAVYGLLSFVYIVEFTLVILSYASEWLIERFHLLGLLLSGGIALLFARRPIRQMANTLFSAIKQRASEGKMAINEQTTTNDSTERGVKRFLSRRKLAPLAIASLIGLALMMPWRASVGNYGTLVAVPSQEAIIRAPESATLVALSAQPGEQVSRGTALGRMGNLELEEQIVAVQSELARVNAEHDRLLGELGTRQEAATRADLTLRQRQREYGELDAERRQIARADADDGAPKFMPVSMNAAGVVRYPAAIAVLQSDVESRRARVEEANAQFNRTRKLHAGGIVARSEFDAAETRARTLALELAGARDRLEAALVEHRRKHASTATEMNLADSDAGAATLQIEKLNGELRAMDGITAALEARRALLEQKRARFELISPNAGAVFGEDLPRSVGQYFQKGAEICRVADTRQLLLRIQAPEREIGDVRVGHPVRLKTRSFPDRVFHGVVTKIGGESEPDQYGQATYRVELTIENGDGSLRTGMTAFARIDFDRQTIGRILLHKIKQALRPEMWML